MIQPTLTSPVGIILSRWKRRLIGHLSNLQLDQVWCFAGLEQAASPDSDAPPGVGCPFLSASSTTISTASISVWSQCLGHRMPLGGQRRGCGGRILHAHEQASCTSVTSQREVLAHAISEGILSELWLRCTRGLPSWGSWHGGWVGGVIESALTRNGAIASAGGPSPGSGAPGLAAPEGSVPPRSRWGWLNTGE